MRISELFQALEEGKKVRTPEWPAGHYWKMIDGKIYSHGGGRIKKPDYIINDIFDYKVWEIMPEYVSVHEAFSAYFEGKTIISHMDEIEGFAPKATFILDDGRHALAMDKARIKLGKWTIQKEDKPNE